MTTDIVFQSFRKIPRLYRDVVVTEKLDGTNGQIIITDDGRVAAGSRNRLLTIEDDNFGFAAWVHANEDALVRYLGPGRHYGEWVGKGIQRGYGMDNRRFALFNPRWGYGPELEDPGVCTIVPVLWTGNLKYMNVPATLEFLREHGSSFAPFMDPEGIVITHAASGTLFKVTIEGDDLWKAPT